MIINIHDEERIKGFKEAGRITALIMEELLKVVSENISTNDINSLAKKLCDNYNAVPAFLGYRGFPAIICASVNNALVHGIPNDKLLKKDDILKIDIGINKNGYIGDMARTVRVGKEEYKDIDDLISDCNNALNMGIESAKNGNNITDIAYAITKASKNKWGIVKEYGGHGININQLHADPFVENVKSGYRSLYLRTGMVLAIEPMFVMGNPKTYVDKDNWTILTEGISVHFEDTIIIYNNEPIITTRKE